MFANRPHRHVRRHQCVVAWFLAGLVFALGLLTVSPTAHAHLHGHVVDAAHSHAHAHDHQDAHAAHDDAGCVVTLFQQGIVTAAAIADITAPRAAWIATTFASPDSPALSAPRYLLRFGRGPPATV